MLALFAGFAPACALGAAIKEVAMAIAPRAIILSI